MIYSLLFTADDTRGLLHAAGLTQAIDWCRRHGIDKVYLTCCEWSADGQFWQAPGERVKEISSAFGAAGVVAAGRVNPVHLTRPSTGWPETPCPCDPRLPKRIQRLFSTACTFCNEIIIDNRLFFGCTCAECEGRRAGRGWRAFHQEELNRLLAEAVLPSTRAANPAASLIWKFPSWHEMMASRGYDLREQSRLFGRTCAGVETRDPDAVERWGGRQPYGAYFTGAWVRSADPRACSIAWFDAFGCDATVYASQAWGAVLAGFDELALYAYGALSQPRGSGDTGYPPPETLVRALAQVRPRLEELEALVRDHPLRGAVALRPPHADPLHEPYAHDYLGMLGIPLVPALEWPEAPPAVVLAESAAVAAHAIEDARSGVVLATSRLLDRVHPKRAGQVCLMDTRGHRFTDRIPRLPGEEIESTSHLPRADAWYAWPLERLEPLRAPLYAALDLPLMGLPARVSVFPLGREYLVLANYNLSEADICTEAVPLWSIDALGGVNRLSGNRLHAHSLTLLEMRESAG